MFLQEIAKEKLVEQSQSVEASEEDSTRLEDKVYTEVIGKDRPGRVRGLGMGPTPSTYYGSSSQNYTYRSEVQAVKDDLENVRLQLDEEKKNRMQLESILQEERNSRIQLQAQFGKIVEFMSQTFPGVSFSNITASTSGAL